MQLVRGPVRFVLVIALVGLVASGCSASHDAAERSAPKPPDTTKKTAAPEATETPKETAIALGRKMLAEAILPASARPTSTAPPELHGPSEQPSGNFEVAHRLWTIADDPHSVFQWLQAHVPSGYQNAGTETSSKGGVVSSWGVNDARVIVDENISEASLQFGMARNAAGGTTVRVDSVVGWTDPRPADEYVSAADRTVIVTVVHRFQKGAPPGKRVVTSDPKLVDPIVRAFNRLKIEPVSAHSCPPIGLRTVEYRVEFARSARGVPDVTATMGKCSRGPAVIVAGHPAPGLLDMPGGEFGRAVAHVLGFSEPHFG
jgi:hypothetical protein